jgi:hypothetical protein
MGEQIAEAVKPKPAAEPPKPPPTPQTSTLSDFAVPRADEGAKIFDFAGTVWRKDPHVAWYGHFGSEALRDKAGNTGLGTAFTYVLDNKAPTAGDISGRLTAGNLGDTGRDSSDNINSTRCRRCLYHVDRLSNKILKGLNSDSLVLMFNDLISIVAESKRNLF